MATIFDFPKRSSIVVDDHSNELAGEQIVSMTIEGDPIDEWESPDTTYHFRIFLVLLKDRCVCLDMQPDYLNDQIGTVTISFCEYGTIRALNTIHHDIQPLPSTTVASLVNLWMNILGRDRYQFDSNGEGCRLWCKTLLKDAEDHSLVAIGSMDAFIVWERNMHEVKGRYRVPIPCAAGKFY